MKAKPVYDYGYLKISPEARWSTGTGEYENDFHLKKMKAEIERHVDNVYKISIGYDYYSCEKCETGYADYKNAENCCKEEK